MAACVETPFTLLQKVVEVVGFDAIESAQMAFGLIPEILDSVDVVLLVCKQLRMVDAAVMEIRNIQSIVGTERIRVNNTVRLYFLLDDRQ